MAESLLSILPADYRECIRGDLAEQYNSRAVPSFGFERARRWYWGQVLRALNPIHVLGLARFDKVYKWVTKGRGDSWMQVFLQDLQYGVRTLRKSPVFAGVAVITLALGIGANTAIFSVVDSVLLNPLPYEHGDRLVVIRQQRPLADVTNLGFSVKEIEDYRSQNQTLDALVEYHTMSFILLGLPEPLRVQTGVVSWNFFEVFGLDPLHGRAFLLEEEKVGSEAVFMMSHDFWQKHFGGDPEIVEQTFEMNDKIHTLVGILPPLPQFPNENDVYMPVSDCPFRSRPDFIANRNGRMMSVFGRLKEGTAVENTQADLATIASRMSADHPESYPEHLGFGVESSALRQELTRRARPTLLILLGTVGFVLLIVCANVANLALARMVHREREMAVRSALGAGRGRLLRQMLTESTLLSVLGGGLGILLAAGGLGLLVEFTARFTPRAQEIGIDGSVLLFTLGVSLAAGVGFGLLPALPLSRNKV